MEIFDARVSQQRNDEDECQCIYEEVELWRIEVDSEVYKNESGVRYGLELRVMLKTSKLWNRKGVKLRR